MQGWYGLGRIGRLEEVETRSGTPMAKFSMAIDEYNSQKGEKETTWLNIICFGGTADFVLEHFEVGKPIFVRSGRVSVNEWEDDSGNKRRGYDIIANRVDFVPGANGGGEKKPSKTEDYDTPWEGDDDEDIWDVDEDEDVFSDN